MTTFQAQQIKAHLILTSAFFHVCPKDEKAALVILNCRGLLAAEMDGQTLIDAIHLSAQNDYYGRAA